MRRAMGISVHTGWAACVVVGGSHAKPEIVANRIIEILAGAERFCFHRAADMKLAEAAKWIAVIGAQARVNAERALAPLLVLDPSTCAIVAKVGAAPDLAAVLGSHSRIHAAEGYFYRDILQAACPLPSRVIPGASLDASRVGKLAAAPWGRDQKLAALAAWSMLRD